MEERKHMEKYVIQDYLDVLSSKAPVPGGGGASALAGALGNALGQMVANLTLGKKKYLSVEAEVHMLMIRMESLQQDFINLAEEDAKAFEPLAKAYSLPSATEQEKAYKDGIMEGYLANAALSPIQIMEKSMEMLKILKSLEQNGSQIAVSDVGVGVAFIRTAITGAVMNVYINTKSMKNRERAEELNAYARKLVEEGCALADEIYGKVLEKLVR